MPCDLWLALRYLLVRRRERFVSVIAVLSVGGVAVGVMALLLVLSVMSGFDHDLKDKLVGMHAHLLIERDSGIEDAESLLRAVAATPHVAGVSPVISGQAILRLPARALGVVVRGLDPEREPRVSKLPDYMVMGHLASADDQVVLGVELARFLGVSVGAAVMLVSPADGSTHSLTVSGLFRSGMYEYDAGVVGVTIPRAQAVFRLPGRVTGLTVRLDGLEYAQEVQRALQAQVGPSYTVRTWMELNQTLFDALRLEKLTMFVILTLIVVVASANIVSTLIMMVIEKTRDIGILKSIGASGRFVGRIFIWQGLLIGLVGTALGVAGAWGLIWAQGTYQLVQLPSSIYYLDHLPVRVEWSDWLVTMASAVGISLAATVYPARQAARLSPVDALRYE